MDSVIKTEDLVAGDVLLYKGTGFISRAIQFFDGTDFSHAALYLGDGKVGEAIASGLKRRDYVEGASGIWVQAHRIKNVVPTLDPVLEVAHAYLDEGNRYGYEQLLLLAFLCLTRKLRFTPSLRLLVRSTLDAATAVLTRLLSKHREPMICSEFVYRAFDEAMPEVTDIYSLWINRVTAPAGGMARAVSPDQLGAPQLVPVRGQGIHPQSLLALVNANAGSDWMGPARTEPLLAAREVADEDVEQLEALVETYLKEVQVDPSEVTPRAAPEPSLVDLQEATQQFAANLYTAAHPEDDRMRTVSPPAAAAMAANYLIQAAADFVTPGDLYKTQSLYELGRIEM
jgi:hypothetical protein